MKSTWRKRGLLTFCRRGELSPGAPPEGGPKPSFLRGLHAIDRRLFCYWHPFRGRWQIYRVLEYGGCAADDDLVHELEIDHPNGGYMTLCPWVLDFIRSCDMTKNGTLDRKAVIREAWRQHDEARLIRERDEERRLSDLSGEFARDLRWAVVERDSIVKPGGVPASG